MSKGLFKATSIVSLMTFLSRILGLVRDNLMGRYFGAGSGMDAFVVAFKIPNFMRRLFAEGAFAQSFVPVINEYKETRPKSDVRDLVARVSGTLGTMMILIALAGMILAPLLIYVFAPGFSGTEGKHELATELLRWTFPYILFMAMVALAGGVLNTFGKFAVPSLTPIFLNICLIAATIWLSQYMNPPILALGIGVFVAGIVQLLFQLPFLQQIGLLPKPQFAPHDEGVKRVLRLMLPLILAASVNQISLLLDTILASLLRDGSQSWLYFGDRLIEFPLGVFAIALGTVILPALSRQHATSDPAAFSKTLDWGLKASLFIAIPSSFGLLVIAEPLVVTMFQYGQFDALSARMTAYALMAYSFSVLGFSLVKILVPAYSARQDTKTPAKIAVKIIGLNMILNLVIVLPMLWLGYDAPHVGLAAATTIGSFVNCAMLYRGLRRSGHYVPGEGWGLVAYRYALANLVVIVVLLLLNDPIEIWIARGVGDRILWLTILMISSVSSYLVTLWLTGMRPRDLLKST